MKKRIFALVIGLTVSAITLLSPLTIRAAAMDDAYAAYYTILKQETDKYGITPSYVNDAYTYFLGESTIDSSKAPRGEVAYARLIDFDNNGIPELLYCSATSPGLEFTVYAYDPASKKAIKLAQDDMDASGGDYNVGIEIATGKNDEKYLITFRDGNSFSITCIYSTVVNGQWKEAARFRNEGGGSPDDENPNYWVNGKSVSEQAFYDTLSIYNTEGEFEAEGIGPNALNNSTTVSDLLAYLKSRAATLSNMATNAANVQLNGVPVVFSDQAPIIQNGRILVPSSVIAGVMGWSVYWDQAAQMSTISKDSASVTISVGAKEISIKRDGQTRTAVIDVPAQVIGDRMMIPLRAFVEAVGATVDWDDSTKTAFITY